MDSNVDVVPSLDDNCYCYHKAFCVFIDDTLCGDKLQLITLSGVSYSLKLKGCFKTISVKLLKS